MKTAIFALAIVLLLLPFAVVLVPPLVDYPNHLAKAYLAVNLSENSYLANFYEWRLRLVPNLGLDFVLPPLARVFGIYTAGRLIFAWSLLQIFLGVCLLRYALYGRIGYWPLLSLLFLYNKALWWGFLNYLFASGLTLLLFAVWILMARRDPRLRAAVFSLLLSMMFFLHLIATAVLCVCIVTYEAGQVWLVMKPQLENRDQWRQILKDKLPTLAAFIPSLVLWFISPTGTNEEPYRHIGMVNLVDAVFSPFVLTGTLLDIWFGLSVLVLSIAAFALRQIVLAPQLVFPCLALILISVLMPAWVLGVLGTHYRVPYVLGCIVVAGIRVGRPKKLLATFAVLSVGTLLIVRSAFVTTEWRRFDTQLQQYRSAIAEIEPGSLVVTAHDGNTSDDWRMGTIGAQSFWHLSSLVVIDAWAFDPLVFSDPEIQSVAAREPVKHIDIRIGLPAPTQWFSANYQAAISRNGGPARGPWPDGVWVNWATWHEDFDYLIRFSLGSRREDLAGPLTLVKSGDWFDLYKINRPSTKSP